MGDAHMANVQGPANEGLVDRRDRQVRRERAEPRTGGCQLVEPVDGHGSSGKCVQRSIIVFNIFVVVFTLLIESVGSPSS